MKKISSKRQIAERHYRRVCAEIDAEETTCFFCGRPIDETRHHHHLDGRDGELFTDKSNIVLVHAYCHRKWHDTAYSHLAKEFWWDDFMARLKERNINLYNRINFKL